MNKQATRPALPEGYRIYEMSGTKRGEIWYIPERFVRGAWRSWDKSLTAYYSHKTWNGAFRFILRKEAEKQARA